MKKINFDVKPYKVTLGKSRKTYFERLAQTATDITGRSISFIIASLIIVVWLVTGPLFHYSDTWQLVINTGTTIITFLMVFLIQHTQNKDSLAIHLKLNELISATKGASNHLIDSEDFSRKELEIIRHYYTKLSELMDKERDLQRDFSLEKADLLHASKTFNQ